LREIAIPGFVENPTLAVPNDLIAELLFRDGLELSESVGLGGRRNDTGVRKPGVSRERLERRDGTLEVVDEIFVWRVSGSVTGRVEGRDTGAMFPKLVLPKLLVISLVVLPVFTSEE